MSDHYVQVSDTERSSQGLVGRAERISDERGQFIEGQSHFTGHPDLAIVCRVGDVPQVTYTTDAREYAAARTAVGRVLDSFPDAAAEIRRAFSGSPLLSSDAQRFNVGDRSLMNAICNDPAIQRIRNNTRRPPAYR